jgi:hypothetical protein
MSTLEDRLNGLGGIPWIPDPEKAAKYEKDSCGLNPLIGVAVDHYRRENFAGDGHYDVLVLNVPEVGIVDVHCAPTVLANEMKHWKPQPGERVGVKWLGEKKGANRTYTAYKVAVEREVGAQFDWGADPADDQSVQAKQGEFPSGGAARTDPGPEDSDIPFAHLDVYGMDGQRELRQY